MFHKTWITFYFNQWLDQDFRKKGRWWKLLELDSCTSEVQNTDVVCNPCVYISLCLHLTDLTSAKLKRDEIKMLSFKDGRIVTALPKVPVCLILGCVSAFQQYISWDILKLHDIIWHNIFDIFSCLSFALNEENNTEQRTKHAVQCPKFTYFTT